MEGCTAAATYVSLVAIGILQCWYCACGPPALHGGMPAMWPSSAIEMANGERQGAVPFVSGFVLSQYIA